MHLSEIHYGSISHIGGISETVKRFEDDRTAVDGVSSRHKMRGDSWQIFNPVLPQLLYVFWSIIVPGCLMLPKKLQENFGLDGRRRE